ncbi:GMC family oxidoreductase [Sinorhizobium medicae]|nr:GMC family oxidoreductase [Sinorhizobium medicae]MDX0748094.1 GMC family oxidoreductase [Sinorhizobium medicae]
MTVGTLIIGSGVAATALAQTLLEHDPQASILILEAGVRVKTKDFGLWEHYLITGKLSYDQYRDLAYPQRDFPGENESAGGTDMPLMGARVFAYGGSTLHWGGWAFRLKPEDFHLKSNTGEGIDWPYDYDVLEPYYWRAENHLAVSGDSSDSSPPRNPLHPYPFPHFPLTLQDKPISDAMETIGMSYGHLPIARRGVSDIPSRHAPCQTTGTCKYCPFGARYAACNYLDELREWNDYPGLSVKLGAVVLEILMDGKRRAKGAVFWDRENGEMHTVEANRVVIAAGAIESAKLLQRSTSSDWTKGIGNDHDLVGRYLITHPYFIFSSTLPSNPDRLQTEMNFPTLVSRHFDSLAEQKDGKFVLVAPPETGSLGLAQQMLRGLSRDEIDKALLGPTRIQIHGMIEVFGRPENFVKGIQEVNRIGLPMTHVEYTKDKCFDHRMAVIQERVAAIFRAMGAPPPNKQAPSWRADHAASVCRMSSNDAAGVVNEDLRVHGTDNLYVVSNAVFPNLGAINPTLTLTALALKLGDHLNTLGSTHVRSKTRSKKGRPAVATPVSP